MKILYINSLDKRYGSTYRSRNIVKALIELGHEVIYIESNLIENIFNNIISINQNDSLIGYFVATCKRSFFVLTLDYDVLFLQKFTPLTVLCLIIGKLRKKRCVADWDDLDWALQGSLVRKIIVFLCEFIFPFLVDTVTTHSISLQEVAKRRGIRNSVIVNQIAYFENHNITKTEQEEIKLRYHCYNKTILGYMCTFAEGGMRDIDIILKWVSALRKQYNRFFLLIIGGGPLESRVKRLIFDNTMELEIDATITGIVPHQDVFKLLSICDAGLIFMRDNASNWYRMSFKVLEYLSVGLPVIGRVTGETKRRLGEYTIDVDLSDTATVANFQSILNRSFQNYSSALKENHSMNKLKEDLTQVVMP